MILHIDEASTLLVLALRGRGWAGWSGNFASVEAASLVPQRGAILFLSCIPYDNRIDFRPEALTTRA